MRIIDKKDTTNWLLENGAIDSEQNLLLSEFHCTLKLKIPVDSGKKNVLSKLIASFYNYDEEVLLWINEYGIWPSCEDWHLFDGFRRSLGVNSSLNDKPGHIFSKDDIEIVGSILALVLYFYWGAIIVSNSKNLIVKISHDEIVYFYSKDKEIISSIKKETSEFVNT